MRGVVFVLGGCVAVACLVLVLATLAAQASPASGPKLAPPPPAALAWTPARSGGAAALPGVPR